MGQAANSGSMQVANKLAFTMQPYYAITRAYAGHCPAHSAHSTLAVVKRKRIPLPRTAQLIERVNLGIRSAEISQKVANGSTT